MSGRVVGFPDSAPLANVQVLAIDRSGAAAAATTDAAGEYRIEDVDPGWVRLRARPSPDANRIGAYFEDEFFFCSATELRADQDPSGIDFELPEGGHIAGRVLDSQGIGISGAAVSARGLDFYNQFLVRNAQTDGDGGFALSGLDSISVDGVPVPGLYLVSASAAGEPPAYAGARWTQSEAVPVPASRGETTELNVHIPAPTDVAGRILDEAGAPVEGATITARAAGRIGGDATTDADGEFLLSGIAGAEVRVHVSAPGFAVSWGGADAETDLAPVRIDGMAQVDVGDIVLHPAAVLDVRVVGADGSRVHVLREPDGALLARGIAANDAEPASFNRLASGPARVQVFPPQGSVYVATASEPIELGATVELEIEPPVGAFIDGSVERREGAPLRGARVEFQRLSGGEGTLDAAAVSSDGDGRYRLGPVPAGEGLLLLSWAPFCSGDPGRVETFAPSGRSAVDAQAEVLTLTSGETIELDPVLLPLDADRDGMDDAWELLWGLDPTRPDATGDPDGDGQPNLAEYLNRTDPLGARRVDGCVSSLCGVPGVLGGPIVLAVIAARRRRRPPSGVSEPVC